MENDSPNSGTGPNSSPNPPKVPEGTRAGTGTSTRTATGTSIDLGDDLLQKTATWTGAKSAPRPPASLQKAELDIPDQLHSARILASEGLLEEAKRILRQILIAHPDEYRARDFLDEIHASELKQIFGENRKDFVLRRGRREDPSLHADPDVVLAELDRDLKLGLLEPHGEISTLFSDERAVSEYADQLERELADLGGQDRLDLGIAFMEMGLYEVALRQFKAACRLFVQDPQSNPKDFLIATGLLAQTSLLQGKPFEVTLLLQTVLRDAEVALEDKKEFLYLMGRAYEQLHRRDIAYQWYLQVREIDPHYRDIERRLRREK